MSVEIRENLLSEKMWTLEAATQQGAYKKLTWALVSNEGVNSLMCVNKGYEDNVYSLRQFKDLIYREECLKVVGENDLQVLPENLKPMVDMYSDLVRSV